MLLVGVNKTVTNFTGIKHGGTKMGLASLLNLTVIHLFIKIKDSYRGCVKPVRVSSRGLGVGDPDHLGVGCRLDQLPKILEMSV